MKLTNEFNLGISSKSTVDSYPQTTKMQETIVKTLSNLNKCSDCENDYVSADFSDDLTGDIDTNHDGKISQKEIEDYNKKTNTSNESSTKNTTDTTKTEKKSDASNDKTVNDDFVVGNPEVKETKYLTDEQAEQIQNLLEGFLKDYAKFDSLKIQSNELRKNEDGMPTHQVIQASDPDNNSVCIDILFDEHGRVTYIGTVKNDDYYNGHYIEFKYNDDGTYDFQYNMGGINFETGLKTVDNVWRAPNQLLIRA